MKVDDIKVFIPSKDFEVSKAFYTSLGFKGAFVTDDLQLFENGECAFFLQRFYNQQFAENLMLQLCVVDINEAYEAAASAPHAQKLTSIQHERWGKVFYLSGPAGELWHVTELVR